MWPPTLRRTAPLTAPLWAGLLIGALTCASCIRPPAALNTGNVDDLTVADVRAREMLDVRVRWGGRIAAIEPREEETCLEIVSQPLDRRARPHRTDETFGRFLACAPDFYDPAVYAEGRELSVIGTVTRIADGTVGERPYRFPVLNAEAVHLWPEERDRRGYYPYGWGLYGGGGYGYGIGVGLGGGYLHRNRGHRHRHRAHRPKSGSRRYGR